RQVAADAGFHPDRDLSEVIAEQGPERLGRMGDLRQEARQAQVAVGRDRIVRAAGLRLDPQESQEAPGIVVVGAAAELDREAVLLPGAVEERKEPVVEEVQEFALEALVFLAEEILGVVDRQRRYRAVKAEEVGRDLVAGAAVRERHFPDGFHVGAGEAQVEGGFEADALLRRRPLVSDPGRLRAHLLKKPDRLEEGEAESFLLQRGLQRMIRSPSRIGHVWISPNLSPFSVNRLKAFSDAYCEKNSFRMEPNRYASPSPAKFSSSTSISIERPRIGAPWSSRVDGEALSFLMPSRSWRSPCSAWRSTRARKWYSPRIARRFSRSANER